MKRLFNILFTLFASIILLTIVGVTILILLIDPNDYKSHISQYVEQNTGRTLTIVGDIHFTFFPWLGLNLGEIRLGNAKGFTEPTFASAQQAKIRVRLLSLFQKQIESDRVSLEGVTLTLTRQKNGLGNWDDLMALRDTSKTAENDVVKAFTIEQLDIQNATFIWDDKKLDLFYKVTNIQLQTKNVNLEKPFPLTADFHLISQKMPEFSGDFTTTAHAKIDLAQQKYTLTDLKARGQIQSTEIPITQQTINITSQLILDVNQETLSFEPLTVQTLDNNIVIESTLSIRDLFGDQIVSGKLRVPPLNIANASKTLGLSALPPAELLKTATLESFYEIRGKSVAFEKFQLEIDNNTLQIPKLALEIAEESLRADSFFIQAFDVDLKGNLSIKTLFRQPIASGQINAQSTDLKKVLKQFRQTLPTAFSVKQASLKTHFQGSANAVILTDTQGQIDEHNLAVKRMQLDITRENLVVNDFLLNAFAVKANGQLTVKNLFSQPYGQGYIKLAEFNPRQLSQRLGQNFPELADNTALTMANAEVDWEGDATRFQTRKFKLQLDDSRVEGYFTVDNFVQPKFLFNISVDTLDLDKYLPKQTTTSSEPFTLPTALLRDLNGEGTLKIGQLQAGEIAIHQGQLLVSAKAGQLKLQPTLTLYEGQIGGDIVLNVQQEKPFLQIKQTLQRIKLAPFLNTITGLIDMTAQLTATLDMTKQQLQITPLQIIADLSQSNLVKGKQSMRLDVPNLQVNLTDTSFSAQNLSLQALGINAQARIQAKLAQPQTFNGELTLSPFNLQTVLTLLGQSLPKLADPKGLTTVALNTQFQGQSTQIALEKLNIHIDDTQLEGHFTVQQPLAMNFDLAVDSIDLNRYLPADTEKKSKTTTDEAIFSGELLEFLRTLSLNGILKIAQLKIAQLTVSQTQFVVSAKEGKIKVFPRAHFYDGTYRGNLLLDLQNVPPRFSTDEHLEKVQTGTLCQDLLGNDFFSGIAHITIRLATELTTKENSLKNLSGIITSRLSDGTLKGLDLVQSIRQAKAILQGKPISVDNSTKSLRFVSFNNTFTVRNEIWSTDDLALQLPLLQVEGKGKILPEKQVDFALTTTVSKQKENDLTELQGFTIPIRVFGSLLKPTVQPNLKAWFLAQTTSKIEEAKQKFIEKSQDKVDKNLLDLLDNVKLDSFF